MHLATVLPCFVLGTILIFIKKGTFVHKIMGRGYLILMLITAIITIFIPAQVGPQLLNHFGFIHLLSLLTIYTVPTAYFAIKKCKVKVHQRKMVLLYIGAIIIAGGFTLFPGRFLHQLFFN